MTPIILLLSAFTCAADPPVVFHITTRSSTIRSTTTTAFPSSTACPTIRTPPTSIALPKARLSELRKLIIKLEIDYDDYGLNGIRGYLRRAWAKIMKAGGKHSLSDLSDLQEFLAKVVKYYNQFILERKDSEDAWTQYRIAFGKEYIPQEKEMRKAIFMKNMEHVNKHNELYELGSVPYSIKLNHFSDRTSEELKVTNGFRLLKKPYLEHPTKYLHQNATKYYHFKRDSIVPDAVDWRKRGYVTPVKIQGNCASCYAFAGIGALEAYQKKKTGKLINLSVQNILDCTWHLGNQGCQGGSIYSVFEYTQLQGVESEDHYPHTMNASRNCLWKGDNVVATNEGLYVLPISERQSYELALQHAVANHGPVAVGIGTTEDYYSYGSGVFDDPHCGPVDHPALVVGYGTDPMHGDYWIIKTSYGAFWGDNGYMLMARNKNNMCHVASHASFPH